MLMHQIFHMGSDEKFFFDWGLLAPSGLSVKDFIAPSALNFKTGRVFQMGNLYCGMSFLSITASDISDQMVFSPSQPRTSAIRCWLTSCPSSHRKL